MSRETLVPVERIRRSILRLRGHNVMVDEDLATLYQVDVKVLNQAVKRHRDRRLSCSSYREDAALVTNCDLNGSVLFLATTRRRPSARVRLKSAISGRNPS